MKGLAIAIVCLGVLISNVLNAKEIREKATYPLTEDSQGNLGVIELPSFFQMPDPRVEKISSTGIVKLLVTDYSELTTYNNFTVTVNLEINGLTFNDGTFSESHTLEISYDGKLNTTNISNISYNTFANVRRLSISVESIKFSGPNIPGNTNDIVSIESEILANAIVNPFSGKPAIGSIKPVRDNNDNVVAYEMEWSDVIEKDYSDGVELQWFFVNPQKLSNPNNIEITGNIGQQSLELGSYNFKWRAEIGRAHV